VIAADGQGESRATQNPGLKPWAVLFSRFAAGSDKSFRTMSEEEKRNTWRYTPNNQSTLDFCAG
jgi:hypothetical protein